VNRHLARLLALLLVPVIFVASSTSPAAAATKYGTPAGWNVDETFGPDFGTGFDFHCSLSSYWQWLGDPALDSVVTKGRCSRGAVLSDEWDVTLTYIGANPDNAARCTATSFTDEKNIMIGNDGTRHGTWTLAQTQIASPTSTPATRCAYTSVCYSFKWDNSGKPDHEAADCKSLAIGGPKFVPEPDVTGCPDASSGKGNQVLGGPTMIKEQYNSDLEYLRVQWSYKQPITGAPARVRLWYRSTAGGTLKFVDLAGQTVAQGLGPSYIATYDKQSLSDYGVFGDIDLVGAQMVFGWNGSAFTQANGTAIQPMSLTLNTGGTEVVSPTNGLFNHGGLTVPPHCSFYYGDKIAGNRPNDTWEEPNGVAAGESNPLDTDSTVEPTGDPDAPPDDEGSCGFSIGDPSTWASAGACALVGLLGAILGVLRDAVSLLADLAGLLGDVVAAIGGLAADIVDGLLDGILALFVPDAGFLEDKLGDVADAWNDTPPGQVIGFLTDVPDKFATPAGLGCGGRELPLDMKIGGDTTHVVMHPFSTCDDFGEKFAFISRTGLKVIFLIGTMMLCVRILAGSVGYQLPFGGGRDE
jgi:hypothetical protein